MASSGMLRRVALVRTDVSEELSTSFIRVKAVWPGNEFLISPHRMIHANVVLAHS
jgi:hypothetical protein